MEDHVIIETDGHRIEGLVDNQTGEKAVLVTHPHPLHGGDMHNNIVESMVQAYREKGWSTLRINFRGVGQSEGSYDQGIGEQEDVRSGLVYLNELGKTHIDLAGYSFGSWVNASGLNGFAHVGRVIMVSPPVDFMDFSFLGYNSKIRLVIGGSKDDIAPPSMIKEMLPTWNPKAEFRIIQDADHFYWGKTSEIKDMVQSFLENTSFGDAEKGNI